MSHTPAPDGPEPAAPDGPEPTDADGPGPADADGPEAVAVLESVAGAPDGEPQLESVAACWPAVIDVVRRDNEMLAALLADARPVAIDGRDVTIAFPADKEFLKRKAEQDEYRRATTDALSSVVGSQLALRYELSDAQPPQPAETGLSHEELVRRLVEEFDAQVLDEDDQEGR